MTVRRVPSLSSPGPAIPISQGLCVFHQFFLVPVSREQTEEALTIVSILIVWHGTVEIGALGSAPNRLRVRPASFSGGQFDVGRVRCFVDEVKKQASSGQKRSLRSRGTIQNRRRGFLPVCSPSCPTSMPTCDDVPFTWPQSRHLSDGHWPVCKHFCLGKHMFFANNMHAPRCMHVCCAQASVTNKPRFPGLCSLM